MFLVSDGASIPETCLTADGILVQGTSVYIGVACSQSDDAGVDSLLGAVGIVKGAEFVTQSFQKFSG